MSDIPSNKNGNRERDADPEPPRHRNEFGIFFFFDEAVRGSSAMPQIGHEPGSERTISGCIGQVYSIRVAGASGTRRFERHAAFGACAGTVLANFRIHRADV